MSFIYKKDLPALLRKALQAGKGFTIIELAISIFVLSVAVVGIFSAFSMITILTASTSDKLTAAYLAQEGIEIVRSVRDINWLNIDNCNDPISDCPLKWTNGLTNCSTDPACQADYTTTERLEPLGDYLYIDLNGFYTQVQTDKITKFKRKIVVECLPSGICEEDYIIKVKVEVAWDQKGNILNSCAGVDCKADTALGSDCTNNNGGILDNCVKVEETLYNWYKYPPPPEDQTQP